MSEAESTWAPELSGRPGPRYRAIAEALADDVAEGRLTAGTRLPTHRDLADRIGVTVGTITRAYAEAKRRNLVSGEVGRGTFVLDRSERTNSFLSTSAGDSDAIDFSLSLPPPGLDISPVADALRALSSGPELETLLSYQPRASTERQREAGAAWIRTLGSSARADDIVLTSGAQHAIATALHHVTAPGDVLLSDALTYPGVKWIADRLHLQLEGVEMDDDGMLPDALEAACRRFSPRALYCLPTLQNPTASVMPEARRKALARIAADRGLAIVEDDIYGALLPETLRATPLSDYAKECSYYLTSLSKCVAPGLRIGWIRSPEGEREALEAVVRSTTWMVPPLLAEVATRLVEEGSAATMAAQKRATIAPRLALACDRLAEWLPNCPDAGYHLWLPLPSPWRAASFTAAARQRGVRISPAELFAAGRIAATSAVRVCISPPATLGEVERGIEVLRELLAQGPPPEAALL